MTLLSIRVITESKETSVSEPFRNIRQLRIWSLFQNVYVHRTCAGSSFGLCRRTYAEHRQELPEKLCVGMPGGSDHCSGLHHLLRVCVQPSGCRSECSSGFYGVELHRRADFQHAHSGRRGEDGGPACEGDDGHLIRNQEAKNRNFDFTGCIS